MKIRSYYQILPSRAGEGSRAEELEGMRKPSHLIKIWEDHMPSDYKAGDYSDEYNEMIDVTKAVKKVIADADRLGLKYSTADKSKTKFQYMLDFGSVAIEINISTN